MPHKWFVTGAAGFIGSNVCRHLMDAGHIVTGFDNFVTGRRDNVDRLAGAPGAFSFVEGDIRDGAGVASAMRAAGPTRVLHLAAQVNVQESVHGYVLTDAVNVGGFLNAVEAAHAAGAGRFLYASSCALYGNNDAFPLSEESQPMPISPYGLSKLIDEQYADVLRPVLTGMDLVGFRFFNIYGPWQDATGGYAAVIPKWIELLLAGKRPIVFGDGSATRDFCFIGDLARLIEAVADHAGPPPANLFTVCSGQPTSLLDLYATIVSALRSFGHRPPSAGPEHKPWRDGDILHSLGDPGRAERLLGIRPQYSLKDGIAAILREQHGMSAD